MSEQADGVLQIPASHKFDRDKLNTYRASHINSGNFF